MSENQMREAILVAARDLFFEKGIRGTSMRDIAGAVGLAQSSLYNHFGSKEELARAVMERSFELVDGAVRKVFADQPPSLDLLRRALYEHAMQHVHGIKETAVFQLERRHMPPSVRDRVIELRGIYEERFQELAEKLAEAGCITRNETRTRMRILLSAGRELGSWFRPGGRLSEHDVATIYADLGLAALRPES